MQPYSAHCIECGERRRHRGENYCFHCLLAQDTEERLSNGLEGYRRDEFMMFARTMKWLIEAERVYWPRERDR